MSLRLPIDEYRALCKVVMDRDGWKCRHCKIRNNLTCHHLTYRSHGGEDTQENLVTLCNQCHEAVHADTLGVWEYEGKLWFDAYGNWKPE